MENFVLKKSRKFSEIKPSHLQWSEPLCAYSKVNKLGKSSCTSGGGGGGGGKIIVKDPYASDGHDDNNDDIPENGIINEVAIGTPAQHIEIDFDSMSSYIILKSGVHDEDCYLSSASSTYTQTNQNITATFDEGEKTMTGSVSTDTICLTQVIDGVSSQLCAEGASFLTPDEDPDECGVFGFGPTPTAGPKSIVELLYEQGQIN